MIFGNDPHVYLTTAKKFIGDKNGQVQEVHTVEIEWTKTKNEKGQFVPKETKGSASNATRAAAVKAE